MPNSVLDAIKMGIWDFEPDSQDDNYFEPTDALPGSDAKLQVLTQRVSKGLPLWHPSDRRTFNDREPIPN